MISAKTRDLILQLKEIRAERDLSYQEILELVEDSGGFLSLSTVRRVFADGSEDENFRYDSTIKPLAVALLGVNDPPQSGEGVTVEQHEMDAMRTVISLKEQINQDLAAENQRLKEDYEKKLAYIKDEAAQKHTHILALTAQVERKDRAIFWLVFALIALLAIIIIALVVDRINPDLGYFWRNMAAVLGGDDVSGPGFDSAGSLILFARSFFRF